MARYHYTRENENGVVLYLESEPAEDAMDEFDDEIAVGFTRYVSMELGETVASWVEFPNGWYLHSDDADAEFTQDGAKTYLQRLKSVWMESPFWDGVRRAMEEKPQ